MWKKITGYRKILAKVVKKHKFIFIVFAVVFLVSCGMSFYFLSKKSESRCAISTTTKNLPVISIKELSLHDGVKKPTVFIGYNCVVYDVSSGKSKYYGVGKPYHYLVGKDSTSQLNIFGGSIIENKYKAVGILEN